jgi:photosystem II stability/assembly factor-like uncharacterized protein
MPSSQEVAPVIRTPTTLGISLIAVCFLLAVELTAPPLQAADPSTERNAQAPAPTDPANWPRIVEQMDFGVPAGNGPYPYQIAVDPARHRVYTFNMGTDTDGNSISVYDTRVKEIIALIRLDNPGAYSPPTPIDLVVDPYRPHLYALTGDRYAEAPATDLFVFDVERLAPVGRIAGVEAVAPGPQRIYLANDMQLWTVDPDSLAEQQRRDLPPRQFNEPLLLNADLSRLYLGRGGWASDGGGEMAIFDATDLADVDTIQFDAQPERIVLHAPSGWLFVVELWDSRATVTAFDADGQRVRDIPPVEMVGDYLYDFPIAATDDVLYLGGGRYDDYRMRAYRLPDLQPLDEEFAIRQPNEIVADPLTGLLYAQYTSFGGPLLTIDPIAGAIRTTYTAISVRDALADPASGRLYVLDEAGTLRILVSAGPDRAGYLQQARVDTGFSVFPLNWSTYGQMSLDRERRRLYIDGLPARSVDTETLAVTEYPDVSGQLTLDPSAGLVYMTPLCRCRTEQCNTYILSAATMTGTQILFPPEEPMTAQCVFETIFDATNRLLYARIDNGVPGSNSGSYFSVFDVAGTPEMLHTVWDISFGRPALDRAAQRAYVARYRMDRTFIHRFEFVSGAFTDTLVLAGAGGRLAFDEAARRLYSADNDSLQTFDDDLTLLSDISLPANFTLLDTEVVDGRLYLAGPNGELLVIATTGGQPAPPPPAAPAMADSIPAQRLYAAPDGTLFRTFADRLYRATAAGTWELLGVGLPGRPLCSFAISPDFARDQTLFAGLMGYGRNGGLYRSTDGGRTWATAMRGLTDTEICTLAISPTFGRDHTLFGASFLRGLFRSTDGGDTWTALASRYAGLTGDSSIDVAHIGMSPTYADDGLIVIARGNLLRSTDGGEIWQDTGVPGGRVAFSPEFARDRLILSGGTWRSDDGGLSWVPSAAGLEPTDYGARSIIFSPQFADDRTVYILLDRGYDGLPPLQRSVDAGRSWLILRGGLPAEYQFSAVTILPDGDLLFGALDGRTITVPPECLLWSSAAPLTDAVAEIDIQDLAALPDGTLLISYYARGVLRSTDGGRTWSAADFPVRSESYTNARVVAANDGTAFAALGAAIERSSDGGRTWEHLGTVPAGFRATALAVSPDFASDGVVIAGGHYGSRYLIRSGDRGATWRVVFDASAVEGASDIGAIAFSPRFASDGMVYAWLQDGGLLVSTDGGFNWTLQAAEQKGFYGQSMAVAPGGDRLILGALYGSVLVSDDRGRTWTDLRDRIPGERVWSTAVLFDSAGMLYLSTDQGVYRSPDAGDTWQRASAGLPVDAQSNQPTEVRALAFSGGVLYGALRQGGVFASADQGTTWRSTLTGEPASPIEPAAAPTTPAPLPSPSPPTDTPAPTPAGPSSPGDCAIQPVFFGELWAARVPRLGCPTGAFQTSIVEQSFERGWMFWRSDTREIYALPDGAPYARFADTWDEGQPEYSCPDGFPAQTPPTPKRGFGKVWCNPDNAVVRDRLGNATGEERAFESSVQTFERGVIFGTDRGVTYILPLDVDGWEAIR